MARRARTSLPIHVGVVEEEEKNGPTFFKIIKGGVLYMELVRILTKSMRIPPAFRKHVSHELTERTTLKLKNSSESSWTVKISKKERDIYLKDGWQEFLRDNSLGDSEFLVFRYVKNMCFTINIFDKNCVERVNITKLRTRRASTFPRNTKIPLPLGRPPSGNHPDGWAWEAYKVLQVKGAQLGSTAEAAAFNSKFPYFSKVLGKSRMVAIPTDFYRKMFSTGKYKEVFLVSSKGKFTLTLYPCADTMMLSGGWTAFRDENSLQVDDVCVFELVKENTMMVHIFRN